MNTICYHSLNPGSYASVDTPRQSTALHNSTGDALVSSAVAHPSRQNTMKRKQVKQPKDLGVYCICGPTKSAHRYMPLIDSKHEICPSCNCEQFTPDLNHPTVEQENERFFQDVSERDMWEILKHG